MYLQTSQIVNIAESACFNYSQMCEICQNAKTQSIQMKKKKFLKYKFF